MSERRLSWSKLKDILAWAAFGYIIFIRCVIVASDASPDYTIHEAYIGKPRGEYRHLYDFIYDFIAFFDDFMTFLLPVAFFLAIWLIIRFARRAFAEPEAFWKFVWVLVVLVCVLQFFMN